MGTEPRGPTGGRRAKRRSGKPGGTGGGPGSAAAPGGGAIGGGGPSGGAGGWVAGGGGGAPAAAPGRLTTSAAITAAAWSFGVRIRRTLCFGPGGLLGRACRRAVTCQARTHILRGRRGLRARRSWSRGAGDRGQGVRAVRCSATRRK